MSDRLTLSERAHDSLWLECCELWDRLSSPERATVVKAMRLIVEDKAFIRNESPDTADTPEEC